MNPLVEEMKQYFGTGSMSQEEFNDFIEHRGTPHDGLIPHSGRFEWGSGKDPYQDGPRDFLDRIEILKKNGWTETPENIKNEFGLSTKDYRMEKTIANNERRRAQVARVKQLYDSHHGATDIARRLGINESTVRSLLDKDKEKRMNQARETANLLKNELKKYNMIDVGSDVERELNISREKLDTALYMLKKEGYNVYNGRVPQITNKNQMTTLKVLANPDIKHKEIYDYDKIHTITDYITRDGGESYEKKFEYPSSLDSRRLKIRYAEDGGLEKDGIVELRRNVPDLSLGDSRYAQVRILVDGTHYIKGMAVYADKMPDGIDVVFNTNKTREKCPTKMDVLKEIKNDPDNPFGSAIKDIDQGGQYWYDAKTGKRLSSKAESKDAKLGLINKRSDEGDWTEWKDALPSQFLSKQSTNLAKRQLDLAKIEKEEEFETYMSLNNPTIKKYYLQKFADKCDGAAVDLKAAALPGQKYHVIIPVTSLSDTEIYAPQYKPGTKLALIRYPHGGIFEIPVLTVTDKNQTAKKLIGANSIDAVCINKKVADRLSGADFDGDTVMCIPTDDRRGRVKILRQPELKDLKGFDPKVYQYDDVKVDKNGNKHYYRNGSEFKIMSRTNLEMGVISNLITDMTLQGAPDKEKARAVKHSMVVIDAEKHKLDYQQSYRDNNIAELQHKWQVKIDKNGNERYGGASTIVSSAKGPVKVLKRRGEARINIKGKKWYDPSKPEGALIHITAPDNEVYYADSKYDKKTGIKTVYTINGKSIEYNMNSQKDREKYEPVMRKDKKTGEVSFTNRDGTIKYRRKERTMDSTNMAETDDARTLISPRRHPMELLYADYANSMKALANKARIEMINTGNLKYNKTAAEIYKKEVSELNVKLNEAKKNSIKERTATRLAASELKRKKEADPSLKGEELAKLAQRTQNKYREKVGSISRRERSIKITDKQWEAIQAGAITENKLKQILDNSDPDSLKARAMPKETNKLNSAQIARIKTLASYDFTIAQIAEKMGKSPATISKYLKGAN